MKKVSDNLIGKQIRLLEPHPFAGDEATIIKLLYNGAIAKHDKIGAEIFITDHEPIFLINSTQVINTIPGLN